MATRKAIKQSLKLQKKRITRVYYFVSISPKPGITIDELRIKTEKYVNRKMVIGSMYAYEWNKQGNPHVHILVNQEECSDADFKKNTKNTFKSLVGNMMCIDIKGVPDDWIQDKKDYIQGLKWDEGKDEMVAFDKEKRTLEGLEQYYCTGTLKGSLQLAVLDDDPPSNHQNTCGPAETQQPLCRD